MFHKPFGLKTPLYYFFFLSFLKLLIFLVYLILFFIFLIFIFLAALVLRCCAWAFSSCGEQGLRFVAAHGLLTVVASLVVEHRL